MTLLPLLLALAPDALAGPPPPGLQGEVLDDPLPWEQRGRALLDGPDACVQLKGDVRYAVVLFRPGGWLGRAERRALDLRGALVGTLDHGTWTALEVAWEAPEDEDDGDALEVADVHPIVGRHPVDEGADEGGSVSISLSNDDTRVAADQGDQALGLLDGIVSDIDPSVTTAWTAWDEASDAVVLRQQVPLDQGGELTVQTTFPAGGSPTALDAVFPRRVAFREGPVRLVLRDAQLHLRGQVTPLGLLPVEESASAVLAVFGFTLGFEQRISYSGARACP